jgi:hypothetical protein
MHSIECFCSQLFDMTPGDREKPACVSHCATTAAAAAAAAALGDVAAGLVPTS